MKAVFDDGSYIVGDRKWWYQFNESKGVHHLKVNKAYGILEDGIDISMEIIGHKIAIPITKPKYWIIG